MSKLTTQQREALTRFHGVHKNLWKNQLREIWVGGGQILRGDNAVLFDLRDTHGERWLRDVSMSNVRVPPLTAGAALAFEHLRKAPVLRSLSSPTGITACQTPHSPADPTPPAIPPGDWNLVDARRVRDQLTGALSIRNWGGTLSCLRRRGLYHPDLDKSRHQKTSGYGWVISGPIP
jgi:hypothetical protein